LINLAELGTKAARCNMVGYWNDPDLSAENCVAAGCIAGNSAPGTPTATYTSPSERKTGCRESFILLRGRRVNMYVNSAADESTCMLTPRQQGLAVAQGVR
jgi:hypothetical protein